MKNVLLFLACCMFTTVYSADKDNNKFGKVTDDEVKMTSFAADTSASAVVLYEKGYTYYQVNGGFQVCFEIYVKIKILKTEGTEYANVEIPYKDYGLNSREYVQGVDGYSYNYVNGKVEKTRLKKEFIFTENLEGKKFIQKFALPNVKAGTLIEYKYTVVSDFESQIKSWRFQRNIPVVQSIYDVLIPEYYTFHINTRGYNPIETVRESENQTFLLSGATLTCTCNHIFMRAKNLPALKKDKFVSYMSDYYSSVSYELSGVQVPGVLYKSFSYTWIDVEKQMMEDSDFGGKMKQSGLLKDETKAISSSALTDAQKIAALYNLVKSKVKWNEKVSIYPSSSKKILKEGVGDNADINCILINVLKDAGFEAYPVVMSCRSEGRLPIANPSISCINYFVVGVTAKDVNYYMDASRKNCTVNVLDDEYLVDKARSFRGTVSNFSDWVDLTHINTSMDRNVCMIKFEDNKMIVDVTSIKTNQSAYLYREAYRKYKNQDELVEKMQNAHSVNIDNYTVQGLDSIGKPIIEKYTFSKPVSLTDPQLYINPLTIFQESSNLFKEEKRELPVEFSYPYTVKNTISIIIPSGYAIEEIPKSEKTSIKDNDALYSYLVQKGENSIQMITSMSLNQLLYSMNEYSFLRDFWTHVVAKNNEQIVLKKTNI